MLALSQENEPRGGMYQGLGLQAQNKTLAITNYRGRAQPSLKFVKHVKSSRTGLGLL